MSFPRLVSNKTPMRLLLVAAAVMAIALLVTACGSSSELQDADSLSGDIAIDGSSTVFPITEAVAVEFGALTDGNVRTVVGISGTGGGFKKFCSDETVISDASRPIKQKEIDLCEAAGIEYIELPVAIDGLSVLVNPANDFVECMTVEQLNMIWSPEAEEAWLRTGIRLIRPGQPKRLSCTRRVWILERLTTSRKRSMVTAGRRGETLYHRKTTTCWCRGSRETGTAWVILATRITWRTWTS